MLLCGCHSLQFRIGGTDLGNDLLLIELHQSGGIYSLSLSPKVTQLSWERIGKFWFKNKVLMNVVSSLIWWVARLRNNNAV